MRDRGAHAIVKEGGRVYIVLEASEVESGRHGKTKESKTSSTNNHSGAFQDHPEEAHSEHKQEGQESQKKSVNSDDGSKLSLENMSTPVSNNSSQSPSIASPKDAKERDLPNLSKNKHILGFKIH